jgi:hypothetical protein
MAGTIVTVACPYCMLGSVGIRLLSQESIPWNPGQVETAPEKCNLCGSRAAIKIRVQRKGAGKLWKLERAKAAERRAAAEADLMSAPGCECKESHGRPRSGVDGPDHWASCPVALRIRP